MSDNQKCCEPVADEAVVFVNSETFPDDKTLSMFEFVAKAEMSRRYHTVKRILELDRSLEREDILNELVLAMFVALPKAHNLTPNLRMIASHQLDSLYRKVSAKKRVPGVSIVSISVSDVDEQNDRYIKSREIDLFDEKSLFEDDLLSLLSMSGVLVKVLSSDELTLLDRIVNKGLTQKEISLLDDCAQGSVSLRVRDLRAKIRKVLEGDIPSFSV